MCNLLFCLSAGFKKIVDRHCGWIKYKEVVHLGSWKNLLDFDVCSWKLEVLPLSIFVHMNRAKIIIIYLVHSVRIWKLMTVKEHEIFFLDFRLNLAKIAKSVKLLFENRANIVRSPKIGVLPHTQNLGFCSLQLSRHTWLALSAEQPLMNVDDAGRLTSFIS